MLTPAKIIETRNKLQSELAVLYGKCEKSQGHNFEFKEILWSVPVNPMVNDIRFCQYFECSLCGLEVLSIIEKYSREFFRDPHEYAESAVAEEITNAAKDPRRPHHPFAFRVFETRIKETEPSFTKAQKDAMLAECIKRRVAEKKDEIRRNRQEELACV
jgi:hypothetical protein